MTSTTYVCQCNQAFSFLSLLIIHQESECRFRPVGVLLVRDSGKAAA